MELLRKLRFVIYPVVFIVVFLFASYCSFPTDVLREMATSSLTGVAMGIGPKNRGLPNVTLEHVALWRLSGLSLDGLRIIWPPNKNELPVMIEVDSLKSRLGIFSLLTGGRSVVVMAKLFGGELDAHVKTSSQRVLKLADIEGSDIDLSKAAFLESALGAPLQGLLNFVVDLSASSELSKDGAGSIKINGDNLAFGPGSVRLPAGGFVSSLTVPKVNLGKLVADVTLDKGQLESKTFSLTGGDLEADIKLSVSLGRAPTSSRVTGDGWFSVKREFIAGNETLKMLFDLIPELQAAQQGDGKVGISIRGTLARPIPRLETYTGAKAQAKKDTVVKK